MANQEKIVPDLEVIQTRLNAGLAKAQELTDRIMAYGRDIIEAAVQGSRIWANGTQNISDRAISAIQSLARETVTAGKALAAARSPEAIADAHTNGLRAALEIISNETKAVTETTTALTTESLSVLANRVTAAREVFTKAA